MLESYSQLTEHFRNPFISIGRSSFRNKNVCDQELPFKYCFSFLTKYTCRANHSLNLTAECSYNLHSPDEVVPGLWSLISQHFFGVNRKIYYLVFPVYAEESLRELVLTLTLCIG